MLVSSLVFACHSAACRPPTSGGTGGSSPIGIGHISKAGERKAILKELDAQGLAPDNPLRHIFATPMANRVLVVRDGDGKVVGGVQYELDKRGREIQVRDMRMLVQRSGHGTAAFVELAKLAVENKASLHVWGAVASAKPFYAKQGAIFQTGHSHGEWTTKGRDALAAGKPIEGHPGLPYDEWAKALDFNAKSIVFACHDASCRPPTAGGTGGSKPAGGGGVYTYTTASGATGYAIKAANGKELTAIFHQKYSPYDADPNSTIDDIWDGVAKTALKSLKRAYDKAPTDHVPQIVIGDFSKNEVFRQSGRKKDRQMGLMPGSPIGAAQRIAGFVYSKDDPLKPIQKGQIAINATQYNYNGNLKGSKSKQSMKGMDEVETQTEYTVIHEYGHHRFFNGSDQLRGQRARVLHDEFKEHPDMSPYGRTNVFESHAEAFADWVIRGPVTPVTQAYAAAFRWGEEGETFDLLTYQGREVVGILDTFDEHGPIVVVE